VALQVVYSAKDPNRSFEQTSDAEKKLSASRRAAFLGYVGFLRSFLDAPELAWL
jgi:hypothetical protein